MRTIITMLIVGIIFVGCAAREIVKSDTGRYLQMKNPDSVIVMQWDLRGGETCRAWLAAIKPEIQRNPELKQLSIQEYNCNTVSASSSLPYAYKCKIKDLNTALEIETISLELCKASEEDNTGELLITCHRKDNSGERRYLQIKNTINSGETVQMDFQSELKCLYALSGRQGRSTEDGRCNHISLSSSLSYKMKVKSKPLDLILDAEYSTLEFCKRVEKQKDESVEILVPCHRQ